LNLISLVPNIKVNKSLDMVLLKGNFLLLLLLLLLYYCRVQISAQTQNISVSRGFPQSPKQMPEE